MKKTTFLFILSLISSLYVSAQNYEAEILDWAKANYKFLCENPENISVDVINDNYYISHDCADDTYEYYRMKQIVRVSENAANHLTFKTDFCYRTQYFNQKVKSDERYAVYNSNGFVTEIGYYKIDNKGGEDGTWGEFMDRTYDETKLTRLERYPGNTYNKMQISGCGKGETAIQIIRYYDDESVKSIYDRNKNSYQYFLQGKETPDYSLELIDGEYHGSFTQHYQNGQVKLKATYDRGTFTDTYTEFSEDGEIKNSGDYKSGIKTGKWKETVLIKKAQVLNIPILYSITNTQLFPKEPENQFVYREAYYNDNESLEGEVTISSLDNKQLATYHLTNDKVNGECIIYYPDGTTLGKLQYENNKLFGVQFLSHEGKDITSQVISEYNERISR